MLHQPHTPAHREPTTRAGSAAVLLVFAVIWLLGAHGFAVASPDHDPADCLMLSAQLFALHSNVPEHAPRPIPWTLQVARFAAPALTAGGLVLASAAAGWVIRHVRRRSCRPADPTAAGVQIAVVGPPPTGPADPVTLISPPIPLAPAGDV